MRRAIEPTLDALNVEDSRLVFEAIRRAQPGGLGRADEQDVYAAPTLSLRAIMALAAERDLIAYQYASGFATVFEEGVPALLEGGNRSGTVEQAIIFCHVTLLARHPDSLIARKAGLAEAEEASRRARAVLDAGWPERGSAVLAELDAWLRERGRLRNPGTTADLVTASLFVASASASCSGRSRS